MEEGTIPPVRNHKARNESGTEESKPTENGENPLVTANWPSWTEELLADYTEPSWLVWTQETPKRKHNLLAKLKLQKRSFNMSKQEDNSSRRKKGNFSVYRGISYRGFTDPYSEGSHMKKKKKFRRGPRMWKIWQGSVYVKHPRTALKTLISKLNTRQSHNWNQANTRNYEL